MATEAANRQPETAAKHTAGPWISTPGDRYVREEATGATIARVCEDDGHVDPIHAEPMPVRANARLISAAPDLLAACEEVSTYLSAYAQQTATVKHCLARIEAAIAKATGGAA